ncbi:hypothetical protein BH20ACT4_BH20ACT4_00480 [soil metagenome]
MAAPRFAPVGPTDDPRSYEQTFHVPEPWAPTRPGDLDGPQPVGRMLGRQGPDQGYVLVLARVLEPKVKVVADENVEDAIAGCVGVALRRASLFGRAPIIHDLAMALTIWGFLDDDPPVDLVRLRRAMFEGVAHTGHHYTESRAIVDLVPEATLRQSHEQVASAYPGRWRELLGLS